MTAFFRATLGAAATAVGLYSYVPYMRGIRRGETRPHVFSWFLWGLAEGITCLAQFSSGAGPGAWVTGLLALASFFICAWAFRIGEKHIRRSDWVALALSLTTLPIWYLTQNPLYAVLLLCVNECFAFYPTFRKSWSRPDEEVLEIYVLGIVTYGLSMTAMSHQTLVNILYPAMTVTINSIFVGMVALRRQIAVPPIV